MVFFVCSSCGASLKKNQVENHWMSRCGRTKIVSCMDCSKEFCGQEYAEHIKCITEDEKYGGSQFKGKEMKGEKKQEAWMSQIKDQVANTKNMEPEMKELLNFITSFNNIPRRKPKFKNFILNSVNIVNTELIDKAWDIFQAANTTKPSDDDKSQVNGAGDNKSQVNGTNDNIQKQSTEVDNDNMVPSGNSEEKVSKLSKKERKEERRKKQDKKTKKQKKIENTEVSQQSKRKLDEEDSEPTKKKKKRKHENEEQLMDTEKTEVVETGGKNKKKKKRKHENEKQVMDTETPEELIGGKAKKRKTANNFLNGSNENHSQESTNENQTPTCGDSSGSLPNSSSFKWKIAIKTVLEQAPEEGMKMSKLQRKVLALYLSSDKAASRHQKSKEELSAILTKKLQLKNDKYVMCNDRVKLRVSF